MIVVRQVSRWQICRLTSESWTCEADATKVNRLLALRNCADNCATNQQPSHKRRAPADRFAALNYQREIVFHRKSFLSESPAQD
jgi:hypothetical protein